MQNLFPKHTSSQKHLKFRHVADVTSRSAVHWDNNHTQLLPQGCLLNTKICRRGHRVGAAAGSLHGSAKKVLNTRGGVTMRNRKNSQYFQ